MPRWTDEQQLAIDKEGSNIIVSAGAGSGKTAVLTARVIRKLHSGVNINNLLILTFTNAAAAEMKERIRSSIKKIPELEKQLSLIDGAYITTFDSFSLSLVKKYHYILGINKNINIADASVIYYEKNKILNQIFDKNYEQVTEEFKQLIYDFCVKNDNDTKKYILNISNKLDLLYDKEKYLDNYINDFYNDTKITSDISIFTEKLLEKATSIKDLIEQLSYEVDSDYIDKLYDELLPLIQSNNYDTMKNSLYIKLPMLPKNSSDEAKNIKENISNIIKDLKSICIYENSDCLKTSIYKTKPYVEAIINIIKSLDESINKFKSKNNIYEFNDISKMAISILINNKDICDELKESLNEIMVDEYQDTSDLQELFISLIENNNVYMVGDIKQSIYRFRNANPYIFKNKYDNYSLNKGGYKIDLNKNFRSRKEPLDDINVIFNIVMDDFIGGADYIKSHQMVFGNTAYLENDLKSQNNNLEILNYEFSTDSEFNKDEIEAFTIARDIKTKIDNKYQVFDKETSSLRDIKYDDFVILMDRATKFDLYKKIFEYLNIPLTKYTDTSITDSNDISLIKNIILLLIKYHKKEFDIEFKYSMVSIARSYLFRFSDDQIFKIMNSDNLLDNEIVNIIKEINRDYEVISIKELINLIIEKFNIYDKLITVGNVESSLVRFEYVYNLASNIENIDYDIEAFFEYLKTIIDDDFNIKVMMNDNSSSSVKIMTIHKSKGLEYPICYYSGIYAKFNVSDTKDRFVFDNKFGIITPYFNEGICKTFYSYLFKDNYLKEEISEKIRLFYVALTRCREKMIVVAPLEDKTMTSSVERLNYKSFLDILNSIYKSITPYIKNIDIKALELTKDYDFVKITNYENNIDKTSNRVEIIENNIISKKIVSSRYSKSNKGLIDSKIRNNMNTGLMIHSILELLDFKNPKLELIDIKYREYIESFLKCGLDFITPTIYKEYEFVYNDDSNNKHGIIDLMLEYNDEIKIIDYKLNNTSDSDYYKQLNGYKEFIQTKTKKRVRIYLYSILNRELKELKGDIDE